MTDLEDISVGETLSTARKRKRLRYKKLSNELNIDETYLVALEEENYQFIPGGDVADGAVITLKSNVDVEKQFVVISTTLI